MGIFDIFKKGNSESEKSSNDSLNLKNPIIKKMVDWIEHPMEFNKKPETIEIIDERDLFWPTQKVEKCYLLKFKIDNSDYIGFTGPITWTFLNIDFNKLSKEELLLRYTGWYTVFATINSETYDKSLERANQEKIIDSLKQQGFSNIELLQNACLGGENYYEFKCQKGNENLKVVGTEDNLTQFKADHILPFFEFIGVQWGPFDLN